MNEINNTPIGEVVAQQDFSMIGMFLGADVVVQAVVVMLLIASFWCWTIIFSKVTTIASVNRAANQFESAFWSSKSVEEMFERVTKKSSHDPMASTFLSAMHEWRSHAGKKAAATGSLHQRIERAMTSTVNREMDQLENHLSFLATVGSSATFVGLFGTVWGIMNSFKGIAAMKSASLAAVAPGVSEALFATALGLIAAIPAMIAYNKISNDLNRYGNRLDAFVHDFSSIISRRIDEE